MLSMEWVDSKSSLCMGWAQKQRPCVMVVAHAFSPRTGEAEAGGSLNFRIAWSTYLVQNSQG